MKKVASIELDYYEVDDLLLSLSDYWMRVSTQRKPLYAENTTVYHLKKDYEGLRKRQYKMSDEGRKKIKLKVDAVEALMICYALKKSVGTKGGNKVLGMCDKYELKSIQYEVN